MPQNQIITNMREIKSQLKALIDSVENMEENAEGMLL